VESLRPWRRHRRFRASGLQWMVRGSWWRQSADEQRADKDGRSAAGRGGTLSVTPPVALKSSPVAACGLT
jgi:hypothetical protein